MSTEIEVVIDVRPSTSGPGFIVVKQRLAAEGGLRLVGEPHESAVVPPTRRAWIRLETLPGPAAEPALLAHVENIGTAALRQLVVAFVYEWEEPRDVRSSFDDGRPAEEPAGSISFAASGDERGVLPPGERRTFVLSGADYDRVSRLVLSLEPERYGVEAHEEGGQVATLQGAYLRSYFDRSRVHLSDLARMIFNTLREETRLSVLEAAGALVGLPTSRWSEHGRELRDKRTYLVEVAPDYCLFIRPAPAQGVELLDIVRQQTLQAFADSAGEAKR